MVGVRCKRCTGPIGDPFCENCANGGSRPDLMVNRTVLARLGQDETVRLMMAAHRQPSVQSAVAYLEQRGVYVCRAVTE